MITTFSRIFSLHQSSLSRIFVKLQKAMDNLPLNDFRRQVGEYVNQTYYAGKAFVLLKGERKVAALLPIALVERLSELEAFYAQTIQSRQDPGTPETETN